MRYLIIPIVFVFFSCRSSTPQNILQQGEMQSVMWDMMQADEMADYYPGKDSSLNNLEKHAAYYQAVFTLHKISKEDFKRSLNYYQSHPEKLKPILDSLQNLNEKVLKEDTSKKKTIPVLRDTAKRNPAVQ